MLCDFAKALGAVFCLLGMVAILRKLKKTWERISGKIYQRIPDAHSYLWGSEKERRNTCFALGFFV